MPALLDIKVPKELAYAWVSVYNKKARTCAFVRPTDGILSIMGPICFRDNAIDIKINGYTILPDTCQFQTVGTVLVRLQNNAVSAPSAARVLETVFEHCMPPRDARGNYDSGVPWEKCPITQTYAITITSLTLASVRSCKAEYQKAAHTIIAASSRAAQAFSSANLVPGGGNEIGFFRTGQFSFDMPFAMPGALGIRYMAPVPYDETVWPQLVQLACYLCGFQQTNFQTASPQQRNNTLDALAVVALGAIGYAHGYEYETIDETSSTWSSLGTLKDCEDFVIAFVSFTNYLLNCRLYASDTSLVGQLTRHIRSYFTKPSLLSGWIQVMHPKGDASDYEGHAWGAIQHATQGILYVECTTPVLPHTISHPTQDVLVAVSELYGDSLLSPGSTLGRTEACSYGPALLQPRERYVTVALQYTERGGYVLCQKPQVVGVSSQDFLAGRYRVEPLLKRTPQLQAAFNFCRQLDIVPDFRDTVLLDAMQTTLRLCARYRVPPCTYTPTLADNKQCVPSMFVHTKSLCAELLYRFWEQGLLATPVYITPLIAGLVLFSKPRSDTTSIQVFIEKTEST